LSGKQILSFETVHLAVCSAPRVIAAILRLAAFVRCMQHAAFSFPYAFSHTTDLSLRPLSSFQNRRPKSKVPLAQQMKHE
jgi:hypothetical protein